MVRAGRQAVELKPGELFFGQGEIEVRTLLGSCVAITLWHPRFHIGGICHYLLAHREQYKHHRNHDRGYYASDAIDYFTNQIESYGAKPMEFEVKLFGGGNMFDLSQSRAPTINVAKANVQEGIKLLEGNGFSIDKIDAGGVRYRKLVFDLAKGSVWVQYGKHTRHLKPTG